MICKHGEWGNALIAAMPDAVLQRLRPALELVELPAGMVLSEAGTRPAHVYFPVTALVSLMKVLADGWSSEISLVGIQGFVGLQVFLGNGPAPMRSVVQIAGHAYRLPASALQQELNRSALAPLLSRYTLSLIAEVAQSAVCNCHHTLEQQLCRRLLLILDRLPPSEELRMTQERIASILGVRREGVTLAAGRLQKDGIIRYSRGNIRVVNREALERRVCECYAIIRHETKRALEG
ncbi:MAG TPA: Crp/Fnr family transcriptional regulator [Burkholderiaceae bacterium]|nr:Crp/Fnr family transcriptional regulator [Burkholderiaceae bacterium]